MDRLTEMEAFVQVVDHGGFTDAARKMGLSKSAVSKHVSALEARLAVRLLNRTTRRVSPTEVGLAYYDRAPLGADRGRRGGQHGDRDAGDAQGVAARLGAGQLRHQAGVAGGGAVPLRLSRGRHQHGARRPLRGAGRRGLRRGDPHRQPGRQRAEGAQAGGGARRARGVPGLPGGDGHAADHRRAGRAPAAALFAALQRQLLAAPDRLGRGAPDPGRRAADGEQRRGALEGGGGRPRHLADPVVHARRRADGGAAGRGADRPATRSLGIYAVYPQGRFPQPKLRAFVDYLVEHFRGMGPDHWP